jgi:hypothetical protein
MIEFKWVNQWVHTAEHTSTWRATHTDVITVYRNGSNHTAYAILLHQKSFGSERAWCNKRAKSMV